jgi:5-formaminoimidazole-4-carboxamide-1-(beta)-D-ribofuranosyl 5'-monophosphate synthetase
VVVERGRDRTYAQHFAARDGAGCVDEVLLVDRFADVLSEGVQRELNERRCVWVPHRSFEVYLNSDYEAIETRFRVPMFGNRRLLRIEERAEHPNQYDLLAEGGIPHPRIFASPEEIDRPVLVKVLEAARGFERAFFVARNPDEYVRAAAERLVAGFVSEVGLGAA